MDLFQGFPRLHAIFFSEFHPIQGPKVTYAIPDGFIYSSSSSLSNSNTSIPLFCKKETLDFDAISEYVIPKPELCNRLVIIGTTKYKVMGYPVSIENSKYKRNALIFNLCFVFDNKADSSSYEQVVTKMAFLLKSLEIESNFLYNSTTKQSLQNIIEQLLEDLNSYSECQIPINEINSINLKLFPKYPNPEVVHDYQVPVSIINLNNISDKYWDLTARRIIPYINGVYPIKRIAEVADVDITLVKITIQHFLYYGCVKMVDIFQFSNIYYIKPSIRNLLKDEEMQTQCVEFVVKQGRIPPSFAKIFSLYCSLKHGLTIKEWIKENNVISYNIDVRRLILFGVIKGFLQRVHKYPILPNQYQNSLIDKGDNEQFIKKYLNGRHHYDEICTKLSYSPKELDEILKRYSGIKFIWK